MSRLYLTPGSRQKLTRLVITGGSDALLLHRPANEVRATLEVGPVGDGPLNIEAVLRTHGTVNALTLRRGDSANDQHLAEWIESIANGTQDSAQAPCGLEPGSMQELLPGEALAPAPAESVRLSPCATCGGEAISYDCTGHPSGVACIEVAEHLPFCLGSAFTYLYRRDDKAALRENLEEVIRYIRRQRELTPEGLPHAYLPKAARVALAAIVASESVPYRHVMDMVGSGRMLDLAERLLVAALDDLPF